MESDSTKRSWGYQEIETAGLDSRLGLRSREEEFVLSGSRMQDQLYTCSGVVYLRGLERYQEIETASPDPHLELGNLEEQIGPSGLKM